ncbi:MAG: PaaI family thioesterase [Actinomycetota bacterium]|nr:PaaI family thioesterase [Actinomycetota bacterium]
MAEHPIDTSAVRAWQDVPPGRLVGRGHPAGDFLRAHEWDLLEQSYGLLRIEAALHDHLKNPMGQLFGGFTPTYVDMVALFTVHAGENRSAEHRRWLATTNMRVDYFEPITGPRFVMESKLEKRRGRTCFVSTRFLQDGELAVYALTTIREVDLNRSLGDA